MKKVKPPNVAGSFYPAHPLELENLVKGYLNEAKQKFSIASPCALIAPHAGHIYSGQVAATAYGYLEKIKSSIQNVAVLSPSHYFNLSDAALMEASHFQTPLGEIPVNLDICEELAFLRQVRWNSKVFEKEHALETHLPFLQILLHKFEIIPLIIGNIDPSSMEEIIEFLVDRKVFVVVSSDLSHFHDYQTAKQKDDVTREIIEKKEYLKLSSLDACGYHPLCGLLKWSLARKYDIITVDIRNSGDITKDTTQRVVGYGSWIVSSN